MATALEQFARECHDILRQDPGPAGRRRLCARLETALLNESFVKACLDEKTPERHVLYEDPSSASASSRTPTTVLRTRRRTIMARRGRSTARRRAKPR